MRRIRRLIFAITTVGVPAQAAIACGADDSTPELGQELASPDLTLEDYLDSFSFDFEPARTLTELAASSELVVLATLVSINDGTVFGDSADDPLAVRSARLTFEAESVSESIVMELPRPTNLEPAQIRSLFGETQRVVLYLVEADPISEADRPFLHNLPDGTLWRLTTPQGFFIEQPDGSVQQLSREGGLSLPEDARLGDALPAGHSGDVGNG